MHLSYLFFMLKKCSFKFLPPRNWNQRILHVVTLEQGLERDFFSKPIAFRMSAIYLEMHFKKKKKMRDKQHVIT